MKMNLEPKTVKDKKEPMMILFDWPASVFHSDSNSFLFILWLIESFRSNLCFYTQLRQHSTTPSLFGSHLSADRENFSNKGTQLYLTGITLPTIEETQSVGTTLRHKCLTGWKRRSVLEVGREQRTIYYSSSSKHQRSLFKRLVRIGSRKSSRRNLFRVSWGKVAFGSLLKWSAVLAKGTGGIWRILSCCSLMKRSSGLFLWSLVSFGSLTALPVWRHHRTSWGVHPMFHTELLALLFSPLSTQEDSFHFLALILEGRW